MALGFLARRDGVYSNTPSTDLFLDKRKPSYIGGLLEMANRRLFPQWNNLTAALQDGPAAGRGGTERAKRRLPRCTPIRSG